MDLKVLGSLSILTVVFLAITFSSMCSVKAVRVYSEKRMLELREEVRSVFYHGYDNYIQHAYPYDELRPLSCDGVDTWGSYSLTLIDALDTLVVMGNYSEFRRVAQLIIDNAHFDLNINVSVFETNIRIIGGLLSAHLLSQKAGMEVETGWPCKGPLLRLAETVARKLLPAFDTATGMPYGTVNLRYGVPPKETPITCTAGVGTFIVEFGTLSRLTGDPVYEKVALRALHSLYARRSPLDLVGNHIDTNTGKWTAIDSGIGAGVDSYFEYLVKGSILFQRPELMNMFKVFYHAIEKYLGKGGWYVWATMGQGHVSATTFQSLETFFPGILSLIGEFKSGLKAMTNYHRILKQYGGLPELYNIMQGKATHQREGYPLRPELIESAMYLYRATGDPYLLEIGEDILHSIQYNARTECGYATIRDVSTLTLEDRMESFFLAETVKYLYLLFDPNNFIHSEGENAEIIKTPLGKCIVNAGGYIFNTEAHPIDPGALNCCTGVKEYELHKEVEVIDEPKIGTSRSEKQKFKAKSNKQKKVKPKNKKKETEPVEETNLTQPFYDLSKLLKVTEIPERCMNVNPLLDQKVDLNYTPIYITKLKMDIQPLDTKAVGPLPRRPEGQEADSDLVYLLKKILADSDYADVSESKHVTSNSNQEKGLKIISASDVNDLHKLVKSFDTNVKNSEKPVKNDPLRSKAGTGTAEPIKGSENRIRSTKRENPDFDLIFGTGANTKSLSFWFSLKWLGSFPELIRHLMPSERFDLEKFYAKMNDGFSNTAFALQYNISKTWTSDYESLLCPGIKLSDRFMFFRSSLDD